MKSPDFKEILKTVLGKLSVFRNNVPLMISVIIALIGILLFIPTQLLSSSLKNEIHQKSIVELAQPLKRLENSSVSNPKLEAAQKSLDEIAKDANSIEQSAIHSSQRELLSYDIFNIDPTDVNSTVSQAVFYEFGRRYCNRINKFIADHNARDCPTTTELQNGLRASGIESILNPTTSVLGTTQINTPEMQQNIEGMMIDQLCQKRASSTFVYIDPAQISGYGFWSQYRYNSWDEDVANCWYSQLGYWVIEDIFDTIVSMNEGNENLTTAPIKRLVKITFSDNVEALAAPITTVASTTVVKYNDRPRYVFSTDDVPKQTLTGRYSGQYYDVIHFKVNFVIETKDYLRVIKELCSAKEHKYIDSEKQTHTYKHNQITVLDSDIRSVDMKSLNHQYYRYGDGNVSEVELTCEYLFNVKGYDSMMPQVVKKIFSGS